MGFVVDNVALGWAFSELFWFSPVNIIALLLYIHSCFIWGLDSVSGGRHSSTETLPLRNNNNMQQVALITTKNDVIKIHN
jgi:hypothetical protein